MKNSQVTSHPDAPKQTDEQGYEWVALSVTTVGALLASVQGSALLIALPSIITDLHAELLTVMWVLLAYLLITTALVPVIGRLADMYGRKNLYNDEHRPDAEHRHCLSAGSQPHT